MTATDELRRMLDERGVEWEADDGKYVKETYWPYTDELEAAFAEYDDGTTRFACSTCGFTPEQAIAATLGAGTCKRVFYEPTGVYVCSECGRGLSKKLDKYCYLHYCPNCGRRVVE